MLLPPQVIINCFFASANYILVGLGFAIIYYVTKTLNFAYGISYTISAYIFYHLINMHNINPALAIIASVSISAVAGIVIEKFILSPLRRLYDNQLPLLLASFASLIFFQSTLSIISGDNNIILPSLFKQSTYEIFGGIVSSSQMLNCVAAVGFACISFLIIFRSYLGILLRAASDDHLLAYQIGLRTEKLYFFATTFGCALGGISGILLSMQTTANPTMGFQAVLYCIVIVVVGGIGNFAGIILGGFVAGFAQELSAWFFPVSWNSTIMFGVLFLFLLIRPLGFLGTPSSYREL